MCAKRIMEECYGVHPYKVYDNTLGKYNDSISLLNNLEYDEYVILTSTNVEIYDELYSVLSKLTHNIVELDIMKFRSPNPRLMTQIGKYCYGDLCCNNVLIEKIGSFCSFANGVEVVSNHPKDYISTHPFLFAGMVWGDNNIEYKNYHESYLLPEVQPKDVFVPRKRITIGSDVWLGENVLICNGSNIGNGVIAGAGAIITKDVPDYAIVVGVPARIIRYRYNANVIEGLNKIKWWDWDDDVIRSRYDDFYLSGEEFVNKYLPDTN